MSGRYDIYTDTFADQPEEPAVARNPTSDTTSDPIDAPIVGPVPDVTDAEKAAAAVEADKAKRAEAGVTGSPNGDLAAAAFAARIDQARFEHRNQGHDTTMALIDDLYAAVQRLEAKLA